MFQKFPDSNGLQRKVVLADGSADWLRPSFVMGYMTGTADELSYPLLPFKSLFPGIAVILCFLHGFLKIRDRCRKNHDLQARVWEVYRAPTAAEFWSRRADFQNWFPSQNCTASVGEMVAKLSKKTEAYIVAHDHPGCRRTRNAVDRPMNRLCRLMYAGRGLHGHQASSERRLRGWALLLNFRVFAPRSNHPREHDCPAQRLNGKRYHANWLHNLNASTSLLGRSKPTPAIR